MLFICNLHTKALKSAIHSNSSKLVSKSAQITRKKTRKVRNKKSSVCSEVKENINSGFWSHFSCNTRIIICDQHLT